MNRTPVLFLNVLIIATCGLVYELLAGTLASYVLGDDVTQFSLIIGIYFPPRKPAYQMLVWNER